MKKAILFLILFCSLSAAPFGNILAPAILEDGLFIPRECWVDLRAGYEGDFVFNGRLKQAHFGSGSLDKASQVTNAGTVTLNILDRLDLYGVFGSSRFSMGWRFSEDEMIRNAKMETKHAFLWGVGARAVLFQWRKWGLGVGGRYSSENNPVSWLTIDGENVSVRSSRFVWREVQLNLGISYHIDLFTPYLAVQYQKARAWVRDFQTPIANRYSMKNRFESICPVGMNLGCTLSNGKYFMLNVEARLISEEAISISGDFRF